MDIRSVTLFCNPMAVDMQKTAVFLHSARDTFNYPLQTMRVATTPFPDWWHQGEQSAQTIAAQWQAAGADYISLGPVQMAHDAKWLQLIPEIIGASDVLFATAQIADLEGHIDIERCQQIANLIQKISTIHSNGFGNLYFTALANCRAGAPFFPVAYHAPEHGHDNDAPSFGIAVESADIALEAIGKSSNLTEARHNLVTAIEEAANDLVQTAVSLSKTHDIHFRGIDFSLAPFPTDDKSLGGAMEALGVPFVGASGSLFAAAFITEAIDRANFPRCGFSGLMLPVLEDSVLARRAAEQQLTVQDLLSYSAVCGVGLDTVPLPGDVSVGELTAVLLDTAALATRLNKPLTARLMPLPGLKAGDLTQFDFPYFANSRVMPISGDGIGGLISQSTRLKIQTIKK